MARRTSRSDTTTTCKTQVDGGLLLYLGLGRFGPPIDTGALYALADRRDPAHERARSFYDSYSGVFFTTDFVFAVTMSLLTKPLSRQVAVIKQH